MKARGFRRRSRPVSSNRSSPPRVREAPAWASGSLPARWSDWGEASAPPTGRAAAPSSCSPSRSDNLLRAVAVVFRRHAEPERAPHRPRLPLGGVGALVETHRGLDVPQLAGADRHPARQRGLFLQRAQRRPERSFHRGALLEIQGFGSERVTDAAAETEQVAVVHLVEYAAAFRAAEAGCIADLQRALRRSTDLQRRLYLQHRRA